MTYEEFLKRVLADMDDLFCPFDGIWCESSCRNCELMKSEYEVRWGKK